MNRTPFSRGCVLALLAAASAPAGSYHLAHASEIAGDTGWDDLTFDAPAILYVSRYASGVLDAGLTLIGNDCRYARRARGTIANDLGRGYVSAGASSAIVVFDLKTLAHIGEIKTGANPDAILYEPGTRRVFSFNGRGRDVTVVDAVRNEIVATIPLDAKPEFAAYDGAGHVFVNLEDRNSIAQIDANSRSARPVAARRM